MASVIASSLRPASHRKAFLLDLFDEQVERPFENHCDITRRVLVAKQVLRLAQLVPQRAAGRELNLESLGRDWSQGGPGLDRSRRQRRKGKGRCRGWKPADRRGDGRLRRKPGDELFNVALRLACRLRQDPIDILSRQVWH